MPVYDSSYTGVQIDTAVGAVITAQAAGGMVNTNGLNTILGDYLTTNTAANTYLTSSDAASTYLTQSDAANTYIPLNPTEITCNSNVGLLSDNEGGNIWLISKSGTAYVQMDAFNDTEFRIYTMNRNASTGVLDGYKAPLRIDLASGRVQFEQGITILNHPTYITIDDSPIVTNVAAYTTNDSTKTGTLKITLPLVAGDNPMQMMEIWIYDYSALSGSQLIVSGYTYTDNKWYNYACKIQGNYNRGCRLAFDGTHFCILFGTTSTTWAYPQVYIAKYFAGFAKKDRIQSGKPTISFITSESGYTVTGSAS